MRARAGEIRRTAAVGVRGNERDTCVSDAAQRGEERGEASTLGGGLLSVNELLLPLQPPLLLLLLLMTGLQRERPSGARG